MAVFAIIVITTAMCVNSSRRKSRLNSAGGGKFKQVLYTELHRLTYAYPLPSILCYIYRLYYCVHMMVSYCDYSALYQLDS